jgi:hypothetical protein
MALGKKEKQGFVYQRRDAKVIKERADMKPGDYPKIFKSKYKVWKPKDGKNLIRIMPATWENAQYFGIDIFVNYSIGADNNQFLSLSKHGKGADPIAEAKQEAQREGDKKLAKSLTPNQRVLYWIIDRNDEDAGPLLYPAPFTFSTNLANLCIDEDTKDVIFVDDPAEGCDIRFHREGTGLSTDYPAAKMKILKPSPLHEDEALESEWLDFINENPLPDVLNFYDYDFIKNTFDGVIGSFEDKTEDKPFARKRAEPDEDEEPVVPVRRRATPEPEPVKQTARQRPVQVELPFEAEEEDEPAPPPRRVRARVEPEPEPEPSELRGRLVARRRSPAPDPDDED